MGSLTKRLLSGSGLSPTNPVLPPVHNMRLVTLQEPLTDAEKDLHAARKALRLLETSDSDVNRKALYKAMAKLQGRESQYFASRYIGRDKPRVLQGWKTHFTDKVQEMHKIAVTYYERTLDQSIHSYHQKTVAATGFCNAATILRGMNNARQWKQKPPRDFYDSGRENITDHLRDIQEAKDLAKDSLDIIDLHVMDLCLKHTENILKLANLVSDNSPEVPYDLL